MTEETTDFAVVTSLIPYGDADLIVRFFTRGHGRLSAFAKGARGSKSRYVGLAVLAGGDITFTTKKSGDLVVLKRTQLTYDVDAFGGDPAQVGRAQYLLELTERLVAEREPMPALFADLAQAIAALSTGSDFRVLRGYEMRLLHHTGYLPDLSAQHAPVKGFEPATGVLVTARSTRALPFSEHARTEALRLLDGDLLALTPLDRDTGHDLARMFAAHLRALGIAPLKTVAYLKSLAQYGVR